MNIQIIAVGKLKEEYLRGAQREYSKRLSRFCKLRIIEVDEESTLEKRRTGSERFCQPAAMS